MVIVIVDDNNTVLFIRCFLYYLFVCSGFPLFLLLLLLLFLLFIVFIVLADLYLTFVILSLRFCCQICQNVSSISAQNFFWMCFQLVLLLDSNVASPLKPVVFFLIFCFIQYKVTLSCNTVDLVSIISIISPFLGFMKFFFYF